MSVYGEFSRVTTHGDPQLARLLERALVYGRSKSLVMDTWRGLAQLLHDISADQYFGKAATRALAALDGDQLLSFVSTCAELDRLQALVMSHLSDSEGMNLSEVPPRERDAQRRRYLDRHLPPLIAAITENLELAERSGATVDGQLTAAAKILLDAMRKYAVDQAKAGFNQQHPNAANTFTVIDASVTAVGPAIAAATGPVGALVVGVAAILKDIAKAAATHQIVKTEARANARSYLGTAYTEQHTDRLPGEYLGEKVSEASDRSSTAEALGELLNKATRGIGSHAGHGLVIGGAHAFATSSTPLGPLASALGFSLNLAASERTQKLVNTPGQLDRLRAAFDAAQSILHAIDEEVDGDEVTILDWRDDGSLEVQVGGSQGLLLPNGVFIRSTGPELGLKAAIHRARAHPRRTTSPSSGPDSPEKSLVAPNVVQADYEGTLVNVYLLDPDKWPYELIQAPDASSDRYRVRTTDTADMPAVVDISIEGVVTVVELTPHPYATPRTESGPAYSLYDWTYDQLAGQHFATAEAVYEAYQDDLNPYDKSSERLRAQFEFRSTNERWDGSMIDWTAVNADDDRVRAIIDFYRDALREGPAQSVPEEPHARPTSTALHLDESSDSESSGEDWAHIPVAITYASADDFYLAHSDVLNPHEYKEEALRLAYGALYAHEQIDISFGLPLIDWASVDLLHRTADGVVAEYLRYWGVSDEATRRMLDSQY